MNILRKWVRELILLALITVAIIFALDWLRQPDLPPGSDQAQLQLLDGSTATLATLSEDRPLLIYYWASWCPVCKVTTPAVAEMAANGENVLAIALRSGDEQQVRQLMIDKKLQSPGLSDTSGALAQRWHIAVTPTFIIINKGKVVSFTSGWSSRKGLKLRLWWANLMS